MKARFYVKEIHLNLTLEEFTYLSRLMQETVLHDDYLLAKSIMDKLVELNKRLDIEVEG